jgi:transforming growth factor-beta-induced protein
MIKRFATIPGMLLMAALLCTGMGLAQEGAQAKGVIEAADDLGLGGFSSAVQSAGLADVLNDQGVLTFGTGSFVIFAPSDEAFAAASASGFDGAALQENSAELKRVLLRHIIWNSGSFENISELSTARTMQGENITIESSAGLKADGANVTASLQYGSGTIYVIDRVLLPHSDASWGVADAAGDLGASKFAEAIASSGLADTLSGQGLMGIGSLSGGPFTVFAPSDAAFDSAKASLESIGKDGSGMQSLLSYHVVDAEGLINMTESNSVKTMLGDSLAVDQNLSLVGGAGVLASERYDNGIVYVIDQLLVPISLSMQA